MVLASMGLLAISLGISVGLQTDAFAREFKLFHISKLIVYVFIAKCL